jgi:hypothetical protein
LYPMNNFDIPQRAGGGVMPTDKALSAPGTRFTQQSKQRRSQQ